jgi:hypothetical protein
MKKILFSTALLFSIFIVNAQVGVGTITPTTMLDVVGDINLTTGIYYGGKTSPLSIELVRVTPTIANDYIEIGNFNLSQGAHNFRLYITNSASGFSVSKSYIISCSWDQTANVWKSLSPISNSGAYSGNDFDVDINVFGQTAALRLRRTSGTTAGISQIRIENTGSIADVFTNTTLTGTAAVVPNFTINGIFWNSLGNVGTNATSNFIGTIDNVDFVTRTNNIERTRVNATGINIVGSSNVSNGSFYGGLSSPISQEIIKAIPTTINDFIEIGNFNIVNGAHNFRISVTSSISSSSEAKSYVIATKYDQTAGLWQQLVPITNTGSYAGNDFELDIRVLQNQTFLRLRKTLGATGGNAQIRIENTGSTTDVFNNTILTGSTTAPTVLFQTNPTGTGNSWTTLGNSSTVDGTNFIGTTDAIPFNIRVNNQKSGRISATGETFFGFEAGKNNTNSANDRNNSAFGYRAFTANATTTARDNTAIGQSALTSNNGGSYNTAVGSAALEQNVIGTDNTAIGKFALKVNTASVNTAVGSEALVANTTGNNNVAVGYRALRANITGIDNTAIGYQSLSANTASSNTAVGKSALQANTIGTFNTGMGLNALLRNTSGDYNTALGNNSLFFNTTGSSNTALGYSALYTNTTGINNTAVGRTALNFNTADNNSAFGHTASYNNTTGTGNVALGYQALYLNTIGSNNTAAGLNALQNSTGNNNTAIGSNVLVLATLGSQNTAIGENALSKATVGSANDAFGHRTLWNVTSGNFNTGFGSVSLGIVTTGSFNTAIGNAAGSLLTTGSSNIIIGKSAQVPSNIANNQMSIGDVIYGSTMSTTALGKIGVGEPNPTEKLDIAGNLKVSGAIMPNNLPGNNGQVLVSSGIGVAPTWESNPVKPYVTTGTLTGLYNVLLTEYTIRVFNDVSEIKLPNAVGNLGKTFIIIGSNGISTKTWSTAGGTIYDDVTNTTYTTLGANQRFVVQSDGAGWIVIGR